MLTTVHAEEDLRSMSDLTRLKPRLVLCKLPASGEAEPPSSPHVVKYRQSELGKSGICALISEVIGTALLRAADIPCVEPRFVVAAPEFADRCNRKGGIPYSILPGVHFATPYIRGEAGPVIKLVRLASPQQIVDLWVLDCWLSTNDRRNDGNSLLVPITGEKTDLYAVDQSDCFGGPQRLSDGSWIAVMRGNSRTEDAGCLSQAVFSCGGPSSIEQGLLRVDAARPHLDEAVSEVPRDWWQETGVDPAQVMEELDRRFRSLRTIVDPASWPDPKNLSGGALLFGGSENA